MCNHQYLNFAEFQRFGGVGDIAVFPRLEYRAEKIIDRFTQNRVKKMTTVPEAAKRAMVELITIMVSADPSDVASKPALSGFSNDGYSESYANPVTAESLEAAFRGILLEYLAGECDDFGTPLLYAGVTE